MMDFFQSKEIGRTMEFFRQISDVPRKSGHYDKIHPFLMNWAEEHGFEAVTDEFHNILIRVPATEGYEQAPTVVIQGHMDMVCEKSPESGHDFFRDPIKLKMDGDWLTADGTSLGADNGIALAMAFDLATDETAVCPPMEILITSDEETGLIGAQNLSADFVKGRILLNIDSEDEGVLTLGCAGGRDTDIILSLKRKMPDGNGSYRRIAVSGLTGGHSGMEINLNRANANVLLTRVLNALQRKNALKLVSLKGGSAHNAIPRDAEAVVYVPADQEDVFGRTVEKMLGVLKHENHVVEQNLLIRADEFDKPDYGILTDATAFAVLRLMSALPHGVQYMSADIPGHVETSTNLAAVSTTETELHILTNQRSSEAGRLDEICDKISSVAALAGASFAYGNGYPAWPANPESELTKRCVNTYRSLFGKDPVTELTHAGLECGIIGARYPGMDMISFGPTIRNPHSPDERMYLPDVVKVRTFLAALLKDFCVS